MVVFGFRGFWLLMCVFGLLFCEFAVCWQYLVVVFVVCWIGGFWVGGLRNLVLV